MASDALIGKRSEEGAELCRQVFFAVPVLRSAFFTVAFHAKSRDGGDDALQSTLPHTNRSFRFLFHSLPPSFPLCVDMCGEGVRGGIGPK